MVGSADGLQKEFFIFCNSLFFFRKIYKMGYAVLHTEKGKISAGGIGNHIDRVEGAEHTYQHADPKKRNLNIHFALRGDRHKMNLQDAINERIKEGYNGKRKIRTDAVRYATHILTGSHEDMLEIFSDKNKADKWMKENYKFIADEFGEENIVRFSVHLDEKTPHIHAITVPITADGRLSALEMLGGPKDLQKRQDRYAERMAKFGLERGLKNTGIKHEDAKTYYGRIEKANQQGNKATELAIKSNFLGIVSKETINNAKEEIKTLKTALIGLKEELKKTKEDLHQAKEFANHYSQQLHNNKDMILKILDDSTKYKELREVRANKYAETIRNAFRKEIKKTLQNHSVTKASQQNHKGITGKIYTELMKGVQGDIADLLKDNKSFYKELEDIAQKEQEKQRQALMQKKKEEQLKAVEEIRKIQAEKRRKMEHFRENIYPKLKAEEDAKKSKQQQNQQTQNQTKRKGLRR